MFRGRFDLFYALARKYHVALHKQNVLLKFVSVKMVVFLTFWQGYVPSVARTLSEKTGCSKCPI